MKVFVFDLMAYGHQFDEFRASRYIPYPLPRRHFDPEVGARTFEEHLEAWEEMDRLGYEGFIGCEYKPRTRTEDGLGWARPYGLAAKHG